MCSGTKFRNNDVQHLLSGFMASSRNEASRGLEMDGFGWTFIYIYIYISNLCCPRFFGWELFSCYSRLTSTILKTENMMLVSVPFEAATFLGLP